MSDQETRECGDAKCGWRGQTNRMLGAIGPLCPECGEVTEPDEAEPITYGRGCACLTQCGDYYDCNDLPSPAGRKD